MPAAAVLPALVDDVPDAVAWSLAHPDELTAALAADGAVLVRGRTAVPPAALPALAAALGLEILPTADDLAPRTDLGGGVLGAPAWPGDREMCPHHERGQSLVAPRVLLSCSPRPADEGGRTVLADTADALTRLPSPLAEDLAAHGWLLVRTFRPHLGVNWPELFGTRDPDEVEDRLTGLGWSVDWLRDGGLRTAGVRPAVIEHPHTGTPLWWGQLTFFNPWALEDAERELLLASFGADAMPFTTARGDGRPLDREEFAAALAAYRPSSVEIDWRPGDLLVHDNLRRAQGRGPFTGVREMAVLPVDPVTVAGLDPAGVVAPGGHVR